MKTYNVICPFCGTINRELYLEESEGWMECECCNRAVKVISSDTTWGEIAENTLLQLNNNLAVAR